MEKIQFLPFPPLSLSDREEWDFVCNTYRELQVKAKVFLKLKKKISHCLVTIDTARFVAFKNFYHSPEYWPGTFLFRTQFNDFEQVLLDNLMTNLWRPLSEEERLEIRFFLRQSQELLSSSWERLEYLTRVCWHLSDEEVLWYTFDEIEEEEEEFIVGSEEEEIHQNLNCAYQEVLKGGEYEEEEPYQ